MKNVLKNTIESIDKLLLTEVPDVLEREIGKAVSEIKDFYGKLKATKMHALPASEIGSIHASVLRIQQKIGFLLSNNYRTNADRLQDIKELQQMPHEMYKNWSYVLVGYGDPSSHESQLQELHESYRKMLVAESDQMEKTRKAAENVLDSVRGLSGEIGVAAQSNVFESESKYHSDEAVEWMRISKWSGAALFILCVAGLLSHKWEWLQPTGIYGAIHFGLSKLALIAVAAYIFLRSVKNYLNHKHNQIVATHRHNALKTYRAIVEGSEDPTTRNIVLGQAAVCIFSLHDTGFSQSKDDGSSAHKAVLEVLASASSK